MIVTIILTLLAAQLIIHFFRRSLIGRLLIKSTKTTVKALKYEYKLFDKTINYKKGRKVKEKKIAEEKVVNESTTDNVIDINTKLKKWNL